MLYFKEKRCSFSLDIRTENGENYILVSLCQNYSRSPIHGTLYLYKNNQNLRTYTVTYPAVQQIYALSLKSGSYVGEFKFASFRDEQQACIRVLYSHDL